MALPIPSSRKVHFLKIVVVVFVVAAALTSISMYGSKTETTLFPVVKLITSIPRTQLPTTTTSSSATVRAAAVAAAAAAIAAPVTSTSSTTTRAAAKTLATRVATNTAAATATDTATDATPTPSIVHTATRTPSGVHSSSASTTSLTTARGFYFRAPASETEVAAATRGCGVRLLDELVLHPPFRKCNPRSLYEAVRDGWRERLDGPYHMRGCEVTWFSPAQACALVASAGVLILQGDSLVRHLAQAVLTVLAGDYVGTTNAMTNSTDEGYQPCTCDAAYDDGYIVGEPGAEQQPRRKYCREHVINEAFVGMVGTGVPFRLHMPSFCPEWGSTQHLCLPHWQNPGSCAGAIDNWNNSALTTGVAYLSGGLHFPGLDESTVAAVFGDAARAQLAPRSYGVICGTLHSPEQWKKPAVWQEKQSFAATRRFNELIARSSACTKRGDAFFDPFAVTRNRTSIDGVHYAYATNILLAQLLLNSVGAVVASQTSVA